ncbi:hypothetical protein MKW98_006743 [Papaver atlanticum]|uniref:Uncharacterized protein n=1 Tax=Papaver atlanticum TaxID=357466 RepID=A0AAD4T2T6_9MAGN|nr:hypothetical protein MKW98_006743 [Papaver atlanticum]
MLCRFPWQVQCQKLAGLNHTSHPDKLYPLLVEFKRTRNPELLQLVTKLIYQRLSNLTTIFRREVNHNLAFCIQDQRKDWNAAFSFKADLDFLSSCIERTEGTITNYLINNLTILVGEQILGLILQVVVRCSVQQDHTVPLPPENYPAVMDITAVQVLDLKTSASS